METDTAENESVIVDSALINEESTRVIVFHKHPVSAKVRFLRMNYGGVCGFLPLHAIANVLDEEQLEKESNVVTHPAMAVAWTEKKLGFESGAMEAEPEYLQRVDVPSGMVMVYLVGIKGLETPDTELAEQGAELVLITAMRGLPPAEMELLRRAYVAIMEG